MTMDFLIPEKTKMLQDSARRFVNNECIPVEQEMMRIDPDWTELPPEVFARLRAAVKEIGIWALEVPEEYGGAGLDCVSCCVVAEENSKTTIGTSHYTPIWTPVNMIFPHFYTNTSEYQKDRYLYPLIQGEKHMALANTEPEAGADAAAIQTSAVRDGDGWIINGTKRFCTMGDRADFFLLTTVTDKSKGRGGHTVFLVDAGIPGFNVERIIPVLRPQYSTEIAIVDCRIGDEHRMEGSGWDILQGGLSKLRFFTAMSCVGRAARSLDLASNYAQQRITFGQPLASRQAIQWMLVDSAIEIHLTRLLAMEGAWKLDQGVDVRDIAPMVKVYSTEMAFGVVDKCIQVFGGLGLTKDLPLERWYRELRVMRITEGPSEIQRMLIARSLAKGWRP